MNMRDDNDSCEKDAKAIFARVRQMPIEPSPFLKSRILARMGGEEKKLAREVKIWRWLSVSLAVACAGLFWMRVGAPVAQAPETFVSQDYVINLDVQGEQMVAARAVEVELPEGVEFVSKKHPEIKEVKNLRLPIAKRDGVKQRLPFIVRSDAAGLKELKLRVYDDAGELISERTLSVNFKQTDDHKVL